MDASHPFEDSSPTALLILHFRSLTDIPFAAELAGLLDAEAATRAFLAGSGADLEETTRINAPFAEARYKCIDHQLRRSGLRQVIELASGFSFRGPSWCAQADDALFVDTDLPGVVSQKLGVAAALPELHESLERPGCFVQPLDLLRWEDMAEAERHLRPGEPVAIVHEGVLAYLTHPEKAVVAGHIRRLMTGRGGVWITPDIQTRQQAREMTSDDAPDREAHVAVAKRTGRSFEDNAFEDEGEVVRFFGGLGFSVEARPMLEGGIQLSSLAALGLPPDALAEKAPTMRTWLLRP